MHSWIVSIITPAFRNQSNMLLQKYILDYIDICGKPDTFVFLAEYKVEKNMLF